MPQIQLEIQYLKGIGPKRAEILAKHGIKTFYDLLNFFPRKYVDRSKIVALDQLMPEQDVTVIGKIESAGIRPFRKKIFYIVINDDKGILEAVWFNAVDFYKKIFKIGEWVALSGKVGFYRGYQMTHPDYDLLGAGEIKNLYNTGKILPFYPENETFKRTGLTSNIFRKVFAIARPMIPANSSEVLPDYLLKRRNFQSRKDAYEQIHLPENEAELSRAVNRFKYEDFFFPQLMLALQRTHIKTKPGGIAFKKNSPRLNELYNKLPFTMTSAQKKVVKEIRNDMKNTAPMNRLLQGDVGSGKTLVALFAMLIAMDNGYQTALMVPTEILAEQHYINISRLLKGLDVKISLLTGSSKTAERQRIAAELETDQPHLLIGTHALIQKTVGFHKLGLVIIDEQHRFGVMQRASIMEKGLNADVLVMTATPIPRTLALTAYGSLDFSVLDELPANRKPITTVWRFENQASKIYQFIKERAARGRQVYIVYPLVEESEKLDLKAATEGYEYLSRGLFKSFKIGLLHGQMKADEKERIMSSFVKNEIQILVSTTVIEVGVDVANATVMLIEHAERFGLSQLHQLRGRVGRGEHKSYCILKTPHNIGEVAQQRMKIMTETQDGFIIAEKDLELRGWGDFFGTKQSGMPEFKLANPIVDRDILEMARDDAFELVGSDPLLRKEDHLPLNSYLRTQLKEQMEMINIS